MKWRIPLRMTMRLSKFKIYFTMFVGSLVNKGEISIIGWLLVIDC
jgi:hypothetical protein